MELTVKQIEATVVILCISEDKTTGATLLLWECEDSPEQLTQTAVRFCHSYAEDLGHGSATWQIIDFREKAINPPE